MGKLQVTKRNGSKESFSTDKIHKLLEWAATGLSDISLEDIEINARISLVDGVSTEDIHSLLIESAAGLISVRTPDYQYVAGRLLNYQIRKNVWGGKTAPTLSDFIKRMCKTGDYSKDIFSKYSQREINKLGETLNHDRDLDLTYAATRQLSEKYLIADRVAKVIKETPQFLYMGVAMTIFQNYPKETRLDYVKRAYNLYSNQAINLPTPVLISARTSDNAWASCCLIHTEDTKESINATMQATAMATADKYGIGVYMGGIRAIGAPVRGGRFKHSGAIPFLKVLESNVKAWLQGVRGGSATVTYPIFHYEIQEVLPLKNNGGTIDNRVRNLDYSIGLSKLFIQRFIDDAEITLFSPHEEPELFKNFGGKNFDDLYAAAESKGAQKFKKVVKARELILQLVKERRETGRIYVYFPDNYNNHSSWNGICSFFNLCQEVGQIIEPLSSLHDNTSEIGVCNLGAVNILAVNGQEELEDACDIVVRGLEEIVDIQQYFCMPAERFAKGKRSLGVGITNFAAWLASNELMYGSPESFIKIDELMEKFQYFLLKSSLQLSKEKGRCENFHTSKYSLGVLPVDTYSKYVDSYCSRPLSMDWEWMRSQILEHGLRHCTLSCCMPCESSAVCQNATNGMEPPVSLLSYKTSKSASIPFLVPNPKTKGGYYSLAFDIKDNELINKMSGIVQKYLDMSMSVNHYYAYKDYPDGKLPDMVIIKDIISAWKCGLSTLYYAKFDDGDVDASSGCAGGSCSL